MEGGKEGGRAKQEWAGSIGHYVGGDRVTAGAAEGWKEGEADVPVRA